MALLVASMPNVLLVYYIYHILILCLYCVVDGDGLLAQALLVGNFEAAVDICISTDRMASNSSLKDCDA